MPGRVRCMSILHRKMREVANQTVDSELPMWSRLRVYVWRAAGDIVAGMNTPRHLSREAIDEFKSIYEDEFGTVLSDEEVQAMAIRLLEFFGILTKARPGKHRG